MLAYNTKVDAVSMSEIKLKNMNLKILNTRINLNISINRLLLRAKLERLSEDKRISILSEAEGLKDALEVFKMLEGEIQRQYKINSRLSVENMRLKKELLKEEIIEL